MDESVGLSIVIPVYNSSQTIGRLVHDLGNLKISGGFEIILVNDGSADNSQQVCEELTRTSLVPVTVVEHTKNYGEHNAVMSGFRWVNGRYVITMDDDFQNPPDEVPRLYEFIQKQDKDVVYCDYEEKRDAWWRNWGSWFGLCIFFRLFNVNRNINIYFQIFPDFLYSTLFNSQFTFILFNFIF